MLRHAARKWKRIPRLPKWHHPDPAIRSYAAALDFWMDDVEQIAKNFVFPRIQPLLVRAGAVIGRDDWGDDFDGMMFGFNEQVSNLGYHFDRITDDAANQTAAFNRKQFQKMIKAAFGVDYVGAEPWLESSLKVWASANVEEIKSLRQSATKQIAGWVADAVQGGGRAEEVQAEIMKRFGVLRGQAENLARIQVGKLNGQLTKYQQTSVGIEFYTWSGVLDDRERETHLENEGKVFKWDEPPAETGNPGEDPNCRCTAIPNLKGMLDVPDEGEE